MKKIFFWVLVLFLQTKILFAQDERVVWITLDGLRWEELFGGADSALINDKTFTDDISVVKDKFWANSREERREKLFPFFWREVAKDGVLIGNRWKGNKVNLTNSMHFSYPGYNEILSGFADDKNITSNDKIDNPNHTLLEKLNTSKPYAGKVLAFGSWDVFPFIINEKRSGIPVNAGYRASQSKKPTQNELFLNNLQNQTPKRWGGVRFDVFTHNYALEAMKNQHPKVIYISYGETDDFAHEGEYDHYLYSANVTDAMIKELWEFTQSDEFYKGKTTFIITTDHGRGKGKKESNTWKHHSATIKGCDQTWMVMFGNKIKHTGEEKAEKQYYTNQIAQTVAQILNFKYKSDKPSGKPLKEFVSH